MLTMELGMMNKQTNFGSKPTTSAALAMHRDSQRISKVKPKIRIIHIFAPEIIKTDVANFRELVQRLTGKPTESDSDSDYSEAPFPKDCPLKNPFIARGRLVPYVVKDTEDSFMATVDLPGICKDDLRVWADTHFLHIKAEEVEDGVDGAVSDEDIDDEEEGSRKYFGSIPIPEGEYYKMDQIEAQMRNGVLKLVIPKLKLEEREDLGSSSTS